MQIEDTSKSVIINKDYKEHILIGFQKYFEKQIPLSDKEKESPERVSLRLGNLNENGKLHGHGIEMDNSGDMYKGEFKNGKHHGWYTYYRNKVCIFRGYAINGVCCIHYINQEYLD